MTCACTTQSGRPCQRNAQTNSIYCWQHRNCRKSPGPQNVKSPRSRKSLRKLTDSERDLQSRYCRCVLKVKSQGKSVNPWAICTASVGRVNNSCKEFE